MKTLPMLLAAAFAAPAFAQDDSARYLEESRKATQALVQKLGGELRKELTAGGPENAIPVCKNVAPVIAAELSIQHGWQVRRVSLKTRNPMIGTPDAWEQKVLADFDRRAAGGEKPETLEQAEIVAEPAGRYFRYVKALPVQPLCLACHGTPEMVSEGTRAKLAAEYPRDRATGYREGQIRGAVTIKRPLF